MKAVNKYANLELVINKTEKHNETKQRPQLQERNELKVKLLLHRSP